MQRWNTQTQQVWTVAEDQQYPIQTVIDVPVLSKGQMFNILYAPQQFAQVGTSVAENIDIGLLAILAAQTLQYPISWVEPMNQVGRFIQIAYQLRDYPDPDMIVVWDANSLHFQQAMKYFLDVRHKQAKNWEVWYRKVMDAARELIDPLRILAPSAAEAVFVLRWAALVAATGCQDSVVEY